MAALWATLAVAAGGVTYGHQPIAGGGVEYVVQVEGELLAAARRGDLQTIESNVPAGVGPIRRVRVVLGGDVPAGGLANPIDGERSVLKPVVSQADWPAPAVASRHTVRQQPSGGYAAGAQPINRFTQGVNDAAAQLEHGFAQAQRGLEGGFDQAGRTLENAQNTLSAPLSGARANPAPADAQRTIGNTLVGGVDRLRDGTRSVITGAGDALRGTTQNLRQGIRRALPNRERPTRPAAPQAPGVPAGGYTPYQYNEAPDQAAAGVGAGARGVQPFSATDPGYSAPSNQLAGETPPPIGPPQQAPPEQSDAFARSSDSGRADIASGAGDAQRLSTPASDRFANSGDRGPPYDGAARSADGADGASAFSPPPLRTQDDRPAAGDYPLPPPGFRRAGDRPGEGPGMSTPMDDSWQDSWQDFRGRQTADQLTRDDPVGGGGGRVSVAERRAAAADEPRFPERDDSVGAADSFEQREPRAASPAGATAGFWPVQAPGAPPPAVGRPQPLAQLQATSGTPAEEPAAKPWGWLVLASLCACGSVAGNFLLGWSYLDARNKYQSALRQTTRAFDRAE